MTGDNSGSGGPLGGHLAYTIGPFDNGFYLESFRAQHLLPFDTSKATDQPSGSWSQVSGQLRNAGYVDYLTFTVSSADAQAALSASRKFDPGMYLLLGRNCVTMVDKAAEAANIPWFGGNIPNTTFGNNLKYWGIDPNVPQAPSLVPTPQYGRF